MKELSVYIHVPFCDHKCIYCDFYSIIHDDKREEFLSALSREIDFYANQLASKYNVRTIFFGGGTPSLLFPSEIAKIINLLENRIGFCDEVEITLETNPGTVSKEKLKGFLDAGINRLSLGVQSFDDSELKFLTRIHNSEEARSTVYEAKEAGFNNVSIDLIFNLPGQTKEKWSDNLTNAIQLPIDHISAYSLILERGTILNKMVIDGKVKISDADFDAELYETTIDLLTGSGFHQYEVSNFSKPGKECIHNLAYWSYKEYLGIGPSAHSFIGSKRWWNYSPLNYYLRSIEKEGMAKRGEELLTDLEKLEEYVMLTLRSKGLNLDELNKLFGNSWFNTNKLLIEQLLNDGYIIQNNNLIKFTPKGYSLCDEILLKFNYAEV